MQKEKLWVVIKSFLAAIALWLLIVTLFAGLSTDFKADRFMSLASMPGAWLSAATAFLPVWTLTLLGWIAAYQAETAVTQ